MLRLLVFDATCRRGLSQVWQGGSWLYRRLGRIDATFGATRWTDALAWLASVGGDAPIAEIQFWGHGRWGRALVADDVLDASALAPGHPLHEPLVRVRARLAGPDALWWWRTCETFGARAGHEFATAWTRFLGCRSAGHTFVIGYWQSGLHALAPGEVPTWPLDEGLARGTPDAPIKARWSAPHHPSTISCLTGRLPEMR